MSQYFLPAAGLGMILGADAASVERELQRAGVEHDADNSTGRQRVYPVAQALAVLKPVFSKPKPSEERSHAGT